MPTTALEMFRLCVAAVGANTLIVRENRMDKEFHFQNWCAERLAQLGHHFECDGRNTYPDFRLVEFTEGYEIKGLAYPGRHLNYDSNSQVPSGEHNGRTIYYIFGRYPKNPDGNEYPVLDFVICHGDLLNADHEYVHKNKSVKGFGSYGDIMIRDRKMYVAPTPFAIADGLAHQQTLILPAFVEPEKDFVCVGELVRKEADRLIIGYSFDLRTNDLTSQTVANPGAGREHRFKAWRLQGAPNAPVTLRSKGAIEAIVEGEAGEEENGE